MKPLLQRIQAFRLQLTTLSADEPLSKLSLVVILFADLVLLSVLFDGLSTHRNQLTSPVESVPAFCEEVFISEQWQEGSKLDMLQGWLQREYINRPYQERIAAIEARKQRRMTPICRQLYQHLDQMGNDDALIRQFRERISLQNQKERLGAIYAQDKAVSDTRALEQLAQGSEAPAESAIDQQRKESEAELETTTRTLRDLEQRLLAEPQVEALWSLIDQAARDQRQQLIELGREARFWFPLKTLLWEAVFILPLLIAAYAWNRRSLKHGRQVQILLSSHLLVIVSIPIVMRLSDLVLDLIPHHFLRNLFDWLASLHLTMLWHFLLIALVLATALMLIYLIQHKLFNRRKLELRRLARGACFACARSLPEPAAPHCPFCGTAQSLTCPSCQQTTAAAGEFCQCCGARLGE